VARAIAEGFAWKPIAGRRHYGDTLPGSAGHDDAEALAAVGLDVLVWGVWQPRAPDGRPAFAGGTQVTRGQFASWLYLAHRFVGPLFFDHPLDRARR
jgi:hypothetical protein